MKKSYKFLLPALVLALLYAGCTDSGTDPLDAARDEILNSPLASVAAAEAVAIGDLSGDFTGTLPGTEEEVFTVVGEGFLEQVMAAIGDYFDYVWAYEEVNGSPPAGVSFSADGSDTSGSISADINSSTFSDSTNPVPYDGDTYGYNGTGSLTIAPLSMSASFREITKEAIKLSANLSTKTTAENMNYMIDDYFEEYSDYTLDYSKLNANMKGAMLAEFGSSSGSLVYNAAASVRAGAVVSSEGSGGKFILSLDFRSKGSVSYSESGGVDDTSLNLTLTIQVYDNSETLQNTYTYTANDLMDLAGDDLMLSPPRMMLPPRMRKQQ